MNDLYRTMFFVPGNAPGKIAKAEIYGADALIYDLEDAVSVNEKDAARDLICSFLSSYRPDCRIGIRINGQDTPYYEEDVRALVPLKPDFLRLPKSETAKNILDLDALITEVEKENNIPVGTVKIACTMKRPWACITPSRLPPPLPGYLPSAWVPRTSARICA